MQTTNYNPSQLEVEFAKALMELQSELEKRLSSNKIIQAENKMEQDNPMLFFQLQDKDGDPHEIAIKIIQRADKF